jgi:DNA-binding IclR family transcriptional regulator
MVRFTTAPPANRSSTSSVRSVSRAVGLLRLMAGRERSSWSLDELSRLSGLPKSTTHRLLETLAEADFVEHGIAPGCYRLGLQAAVVGNVSLRLRRSTEPIQGALDGLRLRTDETVGLAVLSHDHAVTVARSLSEQPLRYQLEVGGIFPAHASSSGKALLAALTDAELHERFAATLQLSRCTDHTITRVPELIEHLRQVRRDGWAVDHEEYRVGLSCIAVTVAANGGRARHAVGIAMPSARWSRRRVLEFLPALEETAQELAVALAVEG